VRNLSLFLALMLTFSVQASAANLVVKISRKTEMANFINANGKVILARIVFANDGNKQALFRELPFGTRYSGLVFQSQQSNGQFVNLPIPNYMTNRILDYLENATDELAQGCDCHCFASNIRNNIQARKFSDTWSKEILLKSESALNPGNWVMLGENATIVHSALYLGQGLYLSKFGPGPLIVTNLAEIKKGYGNQVWLMPE